MQREKKTPFFLDPHKNTTFSGHTTELYNFKPGYKHSKHSFHYFLWQVHSLLLSEITNCVQTVCLFVCFWRDSPQWARASSFTRFLDHTQRRTTVSRTPLDEWSARRRDLYLTTHNTHSRQIPMPPVGFEPTISTGKRPQTYTLDVAATEIGLLRVKRVINTFGK